MSSLTSAGIDDISAAEIAPNEARAAAFLGPFRPWEDLLWIDEVDDAALTRTRARCVETKPFTERDRVAPKRFKLRAAS